KHGKKTKSLDDSSQDAQKRKTDYGRCRGNEDPPPRPGIPEMTPLTYEVNPELARKDKHQQNKAAQRVIGQKEEFPADQDGEPSFQNEEYTDPRRSQGDF